MSCTHWPHSKNTRLQQQSGKKSWFGKSYLSRIHGSVGKATSTCVSYFDVFFPVEVLEGKMAKLPRRLTTLKLLHCFHIKSEKSLFSNLNVVFPKKSSLLSFFYLFFQDVTIKTYATSFQLPFSSYLSRSFLVRRKSLLAVCILVGVLFLFLVSGLETARLVWLRDRLGLIYVVELTQCVEGFRPF